MASIPLTEGAVAFVSSHIDDHTLHFKPVLQVADIRRVQNPNCERYRILLSDGEFSQQGMLATQHNELVNSKKLQRGSVVRLNHFVCSVIHSRTIIIVVELDVMLERCDPIGVPKPFLVEADGNAASAPGFQSMKLTKGSIAILSKGDAHKADFKPVLQVADIRITKTENRNNERYRVLLSDGNFIQQGILATQHNQLVKCKKLQKGSVIRLNDYLCSIIQSRMFIIVIDLDVILERCNPIGVPKPYPVKTDGNAPSCCSSAPAPPPMNAPSCCLGPGSSIMVSSMGAGTHVHITVTPQNEMQITIKK